MRYFLPTQSTQQPTLRNEIHPIALSGRHRDEDALTILCAQVIL